MLSHTDASRVIGEITGVLPFVSVYFTLDVDVFVNVCVRVCVCLSAYPVS